MCASCGCRGGVRQTPYGLVCLGCDSVDDDAPEPELAGCGELHFDEVDRGLR
jgi:hypothetical protein